MSKATNYVISSTHDGVLEWNDLLKAFQTMITDFDLHDAWYLKSNQFEYHTDIEYPELNGKTFTRLTILVPKGE